MDPDRADDPAGRACLLSVEEVGRLLETAPGAKHKSALRIAYGAGPRVSEVAARGDYLPDDVARIEPWPKRGSSVGIAFICATTSVPRCALFLSMAATAFIQCSIDP